MTFPELPEGAHTVRPVVWVDKGTRTAYPRVFATVDDDRVMIWQGTPSDEHDALVSREIEAAAAFYCGLTISYDSRAKACC